MNINTSPFNVGLGAVAGAGMTYSIQHTFDDVFNPAVTPTWFNHPTLANQIANADGNYAFPVRAIRLAVTAGSNAVTLTAIQAGV
jgi:hypothetical protein